MTEPGQIEIRRLAGDALRAQLDGLRAGEVDRGAERSVLSVQVERLTAECTRLGDAAASANAEVERLRGEAGGAAAAQARLEAALEREMAERGEAGPGRMSEVPELHDLPAMGPVASAGNSSLIALRCGMVDFRRLAEPDRSPLPDGAIGSAPPLQGGG